MYHGGYSEHSGTSRGVRSDQTRGKNESLRYCKCCDMLFDSPYLLMIHCGGINHKMKLNEIAQRVAAHEVNEALSTAAPGAGLFPTQNSGHSGAGLFPTPSGGESGTGFFPTPSGGGSGGAGLFPTPSGGGSGAGLFPTPGGGGSGAGLFSTPNASDRSVVQRPNILTTQLLQMTKQRKELEVYGLLQHDLQAQLQMKIQKQIQELAAVRANKPSKLSSKSSGGPSLNDLVSSSSWLTSQLNDASSIATETANTGESVAKEPKQRLSRFDPNYQKVNKTAPVSPRRDRNSPRRESDDCFSRNRDPARRDRESPRRDHSPRRDRSSRFNRSSKRDRSSTRHDRSPRRDRESARHDRNYQTGGRNSSRWSSNTTRQERESPRHRQALSPRNDHRRSLLRRDLSSRDHDVTSLDDRDVASHGNNNLSARDCDEPKSKESLDKFGDWMQKARQVLLNHSSVVSSSGNNSSHTSLNVNLSQHNSSSQMLTAEQPNKGPTGYNWDMSQVAINRETTFDNASSRRDVMPGFGVPPPQHISVNQSYNVGQNLGYKDSTSSQIKSRFEDTRQASTGYVAERWQQPTQGGHYGGQPDNRERNMSTDNQYSIMASARAETVDRTLNNIDGSGWNRMEASVSNTDYGLRGNNITTADRNQMLSEAFEKLNSSGSVQSNATESMDTLKGKILDLLSQFESKKSQTEAINTPSAIQPHMPAASTLEFKSFENVSEKRGCLNLVGQKHNPETQQNVQAQNTLSLETTWINEELFDGYSDLEKITRRPPAQTNDTFQLSNQKQFDVRDDRVLSQGRGDVGYTGNPVTRGDAGYDGKPVSSEAYDPYVYQSSTSQPINRTVGLLEEVPSRINDYSTTRPVVFNSHTLLPLPGEQGGKAALLPIPKHLPEPIQNYQSVDPYNESRSGFNQSEPDYLNPAGREGYRSGGGFELCGPFGYNADEDRRETRDHRILLPDPDVDDRVINQRYDNRSTLMSATVGRPMDTDDRTYQGGGVAGYKNSTTIEGNSPFGSSCNTEKFSSKEMFNEGHRDIRTSEGHGDSSVRKSVEKKGPTPLDNLTKYLDAVVLTKILSGKLPIEHLLTMSETIPLESIKKAMEYIQTSKVAPETVVESLMNNSTFKPGRLEPSNDLKALTYKDRNKKEINKPKTALLSAAESSPIIIDEDDTDDEVRKKRARSSEKRSLSKSYSRISDDRRQRSSVYDNHKTGFSFGNRWSKLSDRHCRTPERKKDVDLRVRNYRNETRSRRSPVETSKTSSSKCSDKTELSSGNKGSAAETGRGHIENRSKNSSELVGATTESNSKLPVCDVNKTGAGSAATGIAAKESFSCAPSNQNSAVTSSQVEVKVAESQVQQQQQSFDRHFSPSTGVSEPGKNEVQIPGICDLEISKQKTEISSTETEPDSSAEGGIEDMDVCGDEQSEEDAIRDSVLQGMDQAELISMVSVALGQLLAQLFQKDSSAGKHDGSNMAKLSVEDRETVKAISSIIRQNDKSLIIDILDKFRKAVGSDLRRLLEHLDLEQLSVSLAEKEEYAPLSQVVVKLIPVMLQGASAWDGQEGDPFNVTRSAGNDPDDDKHSNGGEEQKAGGLLSILGVHSGGAVERVRTVSEGEKNKRNEGKIERSAEGSYSRESLLGPGYQSERLSGPRDGSGRRGLVARGTVRGRGGENRDTVVQHVRRSDLLGFSGFKGRAGGRGSVEGGAAKGRGGESRGRGGQHLRRSDLLKLSRM